MTHALLMLAQVGPNTSADPPADTSFLVLWAILLLAAAFILFFAEVFVPSGGIIALVGASCLVVGIVLLFQINTTLGLVGALAALIALPIIIGFGLKVWPDLPWIKSFILNDQQDADHADDDAADAEAGLVAGAQGQAMTDLRPVGTCLLGGKREECLATSGVIHAGDAVRVVCVDGMQIKVEKAG